MHDAVESKHGDHGRKQTDHESRSRAAPPLTNSELSKHGFSTRFGREDQQRDDNGE